MIRGWCQTLCALVPNYIAILPKRAMSGSKYAYVRNFELPDPMLPGTFIVLRVDGHSFHRCAPQISQAHRSNTNLRGSRFSDEHEFTKPNDTRALALMDHAAKDIMEQYADIVLAFGESDEFRSSFDSCHQILPLLNSFLSWHLGVASSFDNRHPCITDDSQRSCRL
jgi:hypothetical protein